MFALRAPAVILADNYPPAAKILFARMAVKPSRALARIYADYIIYLMQKGIWASLDLYYVLASHDRQASLLNWRSPAYDLAVSGSPTFTASRGWKGNGTDGRLNAAGYNPASVPRVITQDSITLGAYIRTAATANIGQDVNCGTARLARGSVNYQVRVNDTTSLATTPASYAGHFAARRSGATTRSSWKDGASARLIVRRPPQSRLPSTSSRPTRVRISAIAKRRSLTSALLLPISRWPITTPA